MRWLLVKDLRILSRSPLLVALCLALSAPVCMLLAGLRLPGLGLTLSVAVSQLLFHGLFSVSGSMSAAVDHTSHAGHLGAASDGPELVLSATGAMVHDHAALEALGVSSSSAAWLMPVLHAAAGIVTVLVLRHGEKLALRAAELKCDIIFKATKVDGIYTSDPEKNPDAERLPHVTYQRVLSDRLQVMDAAAIDLARNSSIPIYIFSLREKGNIKRALLGEVEREPEQPV